MRGIRFQTVMLPRMMTVILSGLSNITSIKLGLYITEMSYNFIVHVSHRHAPHILRLHKLFLFLSPRVSHISIPPPDNSPNLPVALPLLFFYYLSVYLFPLFPLHPGTRAGVRCQRPAACLGPAGRQS